MTCGVQRSLSGSPVYCDRSDANTHGGRHTGLITVSVFGRVLTSTRVYWENTTSRMVFQKTAVLGESDFIAPSNQAAGAYIVGKTPEPDPEEPPPVDPPPQTPIDETTPFTASGTYSIPPEAKYLDIIVLGGSGGGESSQAARGGYAGQPGSFSSVTVERGVSFHTSATTCAVVVGAGGGGNVTWYALGQNGSPSTVTYKNASNVDAVVTGAAGKGGSQSGNPSTSSTSVAAGTHTRNSLPYAGGGSSTANNAGKVPGGGAGGCSYASLGPAGARGQVWIRAYN